MYFRTFFIKNCRSFQSFYNCKNFGIGIINQEYVMITVPQSYGSVVQGM